jgi:Holliday junction DNA helicase RuvA
MPLVGEEVTLLIRQIVREDTLSLYGFLTTFQRRLFDLLLGVNGCGPKAATALLGQLGEDSVATAIVTQDAKVLMRATGVGAKLAERMILELKDKMPQEALLRKVESATRGPVKSLDEVVDALLALGYRRAEAEVAADKAVGSSVEDRLRAALLVLRR